MDITITPAKLEGSVTPPPSKSQAHRALIAAALADGESVISNVAFSQDIEATLDCLDNLGANFERNGSTVTVRGMGASAMSPLRRLAYPHLDCGESGSTLRFLIPIALAVRGGGIFSGRGRLMERPQKPYFDLFDEKGIYHELKDGVLTVTGMLAPGKYRLPGNVSSQFVTGLLYALPLRDGDSEIVLTSPLESWGYVDMTLDVLKQSGIVVKETGSGFLIPGRQVYRPHDFAIEADWSQAGFWYAAKFLGNPVDVNGLNPNSAQGDSVIDAQFEELGLELGPGLALELDVSNCPDLVPPLAAMAALRAGQTTRLVNAARLRMKESDRLASVTAVLSALGADVTEGPDFLTIRGQGSLAGGVKVNSFNDHRVAMMAAIAATRCEKPVTVLGAECVAKSYPDFWEEYEKLGGTIRREYDLSLAPIGPDNWRDAAFLTTDPERKNPLDQEWIANNAFSMLQAVYDPVWTCRLILSDGKPAGFVFFGLEEGESAPLLCRYMVDVRHQGKGLGTQALPIVIEEMYRVYGRREIHLSVEPENRRAVQMYEKFGFRSTGRMEYTEEIYALPAPPQEVTP